MPPGMPDEATTTLEPPDARPGAPPAPPEFDAPPAPCPDCGGPIPDKYCTACGEKRFEAADYTLRRFLAETFRAVTDLEMPLARSILALLFRPGLLTSEYLSGRRKRYLKPLQLFVLCNVIYFFAQPFTGFNTLTTPLYVHLNGLPYSPAVRHMVAEAVREKRTTFDDYRARFDATIQNQAKSMVVLMVPLFALFLKLLYRRRPAVGHLVFSLHFYALFLLLLLFVNGSAALIPRASPRLGLLMRSLDEDVLFTLLLLLLAGVYVFLALRRAYAERPRAALLKTLPLVLSLMVIVQTYRLALFFTAFYTTSYTN